MAMRLTTVVFLGVTACATSGGTSGGGLFPGDEQHEAAAFAATRARASFDIDCEQVQMVRLGDVTRPLQQMTVMSVGARGCGKKASYVVKCTSNWGNISCNPQLNSKD